MGRKKPVGKSGWLRVNRYLTARKRAIELTEGLDEGGLRMKEGEEVKTRLSLLIHSAMKSLTVQNNQNFFFFTKE